MGYPVGREGRCVLTALRGCSSGGRWTPIGICTIRARTQPALTRTIFSRLRQQSIFLNTRRITPFTTLLGRRHAVAGTLYREIISESLSGTGVPTVDARRVYVNGRSLNIELASEAGVRFRRLIARMDTNSPPTIFTNTSGSRTAKSATPSLVSRTLANLLRLAPRTRLNRRARTANSATRGLKRIFTITGHPISVPSFAEFATKQRASPPTPLVRQNSQKSLTKLLEAFA